jgi:hypothetical protein
MAALSIGSLTPNKSLGPVPSRLLLDICDRGMSGQVWQQLLPILKLSFAGLPTNR